MTTDALARAQAVLQREGCETVARVTRNMFVAALDPDELAAVILSSWRQFVVDGIRQEPAAFAEQFARDVISTVVGVPIKRGYPVMRADDNTVHGRVLDVLFDGAMLTVKWFGGDVETVSADQVRPAARA